MRTVVLVVGAVVVVLLATFVTVMVRRSSKSTAVGAGPADPATTTTVGPASSSTPPPAPADSSTSTTIADPVAAFKNSLLTVGDVTVQLRDGSGSTTNAGNPFVVGTAYATGATRWPAMGVVAVNLGAGPTTAFVALMDKPGTVHTAAAIGDRLLIQSMSEVPEGISIDYLDRRPDQAGADAPTVPYRVVFNATTGQLSTPAPLSPAPPTTATAPPRTFVMNDGAHTRAGPSTGTAVRGDVFRGQAVAVVCQTVGELVTNGPATDAGSEVWDRLADGNYVADLFVETPKQMSTNQGLSVPVPSDSLPRC